MFGNHHHGRTKINKYTESAQACSHCEFRPWGDLQPHAKAMGRSTWVSHGSVLALHESRGAKQGRVLAQSWRGTAGRGSWRAGSVHHGELNGKSSPRGQNGLTRPADLLWEELCWCFPRCAAAIQKEDFANTSAQKKDLSHLHPTLVPKETPSSW